MLLLSFIAVVLKIVKTEKEYSLQSLFLNAYMLPEVKKTQMRVCVQGNWGKFTFKNSMSFLMCLWRSQENN